LISLSSYLNYLATHNRMYNQFSTTRKRSGADCIRIINRRSIRAALIVLAVFGTYFPLAYWAKTSFEPDRYAYGPDVPGEKRRLYKPFGRQGTSSASFAFAKERYSLFDDLTDSPDNNERSPIELYEDGRRLGPAHSAPSDIEKLGRGRFLHWSQHGTIFYFSASDNSDPNTNGRAYWVVKPQNPGVNRRTLN
jgi:hypothetical protein